MEGWCLGVRKPVWGGSLVGWSKIMNQVGLLHQLWDDLYFPILEKILVSFGEKRGSSWWKVLAWKALSSCCPAFRSVMGENVMLMMDMEWSWEVLTILERWKVSRMEEVRLAIWFPFAMVRKKVVFIPQLCPFYLALFFLYFYSYFYSLQEMRKIQRRAERFITLTNYYTLVTFYHLVKIYKIMHKFNRLMILEALLTCHYWAMWLVPRFLCLFAYDNFF